MHALKQDLIYGIRMLFRSPGFTVAAVLSLALGIGANTVIFSLINTTLLRPLDYREPDRLVAIRTVPKDRPDARGSANMASYLAWRERAQSFESMGSFFGFQSSAGPDENSPAEMLSGQFVSSSIFATIGVEPALGRTFTEEEGEPVTFAPLTLISERLWERRYGRDPEIVGKTVELDRVTTTIVGVMPPGFDLFQDSSDYWAVSGITRQRLESSGGLVIVVGRLKPGVSIEQAQLEMDAITAQLATEDPARHEGTSARVMSLQESFLGVFRDPLLILQVAVGFVLLIGCANVAGLLLARGASRQTEVAVRSAVGAGRWRIVRQLLTENIVLAAAGGLLGLGLAWGGLQLFIASAPPGFPRLDELALDRQVLGFTALIALLTGIVFGLIPALGASRPDLVESLKESTRGAGTGLVRQRFRTVLVTLQIALALMLLMGAGLMINSFVRIQRNDLGMDPDGLLAFQFRFPALEVMRPVGTYRTSGLYDVDPNVLLTLERMRERLQAVPGAISIAAASGPPMGGAIGMPFRIEGQAAADASGPAPGALYMGVSPNYFSTLRIPVLQGRDFSGLDTETGARVVIINQSMAERYWPGGSPLGESITIDYLPNDPPREVIAVVGDMRLSRTQQEPGPMMYVPLAQQGLQWIGPQLGARAGAYFVMRTAAGDPMSLLPVARQAIAEIDKNQPVSNIHTIEQVLGGQIQYYRLYMLLLGVFGGSAALLAAIGIYGVMAFSIAQRRREIGIRMALGAQRGDVVRLVGKQALVMVALGLIIGLAGSFALTRFIASALWNVEPTDPLTFAAVSVFFAVVALMACIVPTRQAANVDPTIALRAD